MSPEGERREIARRHLESADDYQLSAAFGPNYWDATITPATHVINPRLKKSVAERRAAEPTRFRRNIDATQFGETIGLALHPQLYQAHFRTTFATAYPNGENEARTFLVRLNDHRNRLSHGGTCSQRDLEQCER
jgi:hypothetical protein